MKSTRPRPQAASDSTPRTSPEVANRVETRSAPENASPALLGAFSEQAWQRWRVHLIAPFQDGWALGFCPRCQAHDTTASTPYLTAHLEQGHFLCHQCGHHGQADVAPAHYRQSRAQLGQGWWEPLTTEAAETLLAQALPTGLPAGVELGRGLGLVLDEQGRGQWQEALFFPCHLKSEGPLSGAIFLPLTSEGGFGAPQAVQGTDAAPWGWDRLEGDQAVFVEHPIDGLAMMMAGVSNVVVVSPRMSPLQPGGGDWSILTQLEKPLGQLSRMVMAMRADDGGQRLEDELARRLGKDRCLRVRWQNFGLSGAQACAQTLLQTEGPGAVREAVQKAPAFPVAGVHEFYDVEESFDVLYEFGLQPGVSTGWPTLDLNYTVKLGQWTVLTGIPGHGKSTFIDALAVNLAQLHQWKFGVFSPESQPIERHYASLLEKAVGAPFSEGRHPRISVETKNKLKSWLNDHFKMILPDEDREGNWSVDAILSLARTLVFRHGIRGLIIDPWNELNHMRPPHVSEADYVAMELTKIRRFARTYGVHVFVVVHPNKQEKGPDGKYSVITPYMLAGGANWRNKADNIISGFRNLTQEDEDIFDLYIQKIRFKEVGRIGRASLRGDPLTGRYIDDIDQSKREMSLRSPRALPTAQQQIPKPRTPRLGNGMPIEAGNGLPTVF